MKTFYLQTALLLITITVIIKALSKCIGLIISPVTSFYLHVCLFTTTSLLNCIIIPYDDSLAMRGPQLMVSVGLW